MISNVISLEFLSDLPYLRRIALWHVAGTVYRATWFCLTGGQRGGTGGLLTALVAPVTATSSRSSWPWTAAHLAAQTAQ